VVEYTSEAVELDTEEKETVVEQDDLDKLHSEHSSETRESVCHT